MQFGGIRVAKVFGIEIWLDYSWLIIFILVFITFTAGLLPSMFPGLSRPAAVVTGLITTLLFFASVIAHELSHSLYAKSQGLEIRRITLFIFGGASELVDEPRSAKEEYVMAAVGPLTSLALGIFFSFLWLIGRAVDYLPITALSGVLAVINISLAIFNLLPGFPLDGGRIFRSLVWLRTGNLERATRYASIGGRALGILLIAYGVVALLLTGLFGGLWMILIGFFLYRAAGLSYAQTMSRIVLKDVKVGELVNRKFVAVSRSMRARNLLRQYVRRYKDPVVAVEPSKRRTASVLDVRQIPEWGLDQRLSRFVSKENYALDPQDPALKALETMTRTGLGKLPVVRKGKLAGIITADHIQAYVAGRSRLGA